MNIKSIFPILFLGTIVGTACALTSCGSGEQIRSIAEINFSLSQLNLTIDQITSVDIRNWFVGNSTEPYLGQNNKNVKNVGVIQGKKYDEIFANYDEEFSKNNFIWFRSSQKENDDLNACFEFSISYSNVDACFIYFGTKALQVNDTMSLKGSFYVGNDPSTSTPPPEPYSTAAVTIKVIA